MRQLGNFCISESCSSLEELFKPGEKRLTEAVNKLKAATGKLFIQKMKLKSSEINLFTLAQGFDPDT